MSCAALSIFGLAVPAHATTIINFSSTTAGGDITTLTATGTNDPVLGIGSPSPDPPEVFNTLTITGGPANGTYNPVFLDEIFNSTTDMLTVSGTITTFPVFSNLTTTSTLATIVFSSGLTANATASNVSLNFPTDVVSITLGSAFAADLGLPTTMPTSALSALTLLGNSNGAPGNFSSTSGSLVLNDPVPEPDSWLMASLGLALLVFGSRRKFSRVP